MTKMERSSKNPKMKNDEGGIGYELKKGLWTPEEDQKLLSYIQQFGHGRWRSLSAKAGLKRCGKSCRLRWNNYLRPDIEKGSFTLEEERTIIQLHALLGNRWSAIAAHMPKRTDSMIKNHWNAHIKKRLVKMGIDPLTHKPKVDTHLPGSNLSHMTQWEAARLEAEARLAQQPKHYPYHQQPYFVLPLSTHEIPKRPAIPYSQCLDALNVWQGTIRSKYLINGCLQTPNSTPSTLMINYDESKGSSDQEVNSRPHEKSEIVMHPFEEFGYPHEANFTIDDPLIKPSDFLGSCVDLLINGTGNHEPNNIRWME